MAEVLRPVQLAVEKDLSGGVRLTLGGSMAVMSPEQAFELAMVVLDKIGVRPEIGGVAGRPQKHFRPG